VELARQVLKTYPDHFMTNSILGGLLFDMGKYTEAAAALNFAHDARPDHLDTLVLLTASSGMAGLDDAEPLYRHLLEDSAYRDTPKAFVPHNELAVWLIRKERYDDALDELVRAKELSENHPMIYLNLAILYDMHLNDPAKARGYYTKFLLVGEIKYPEQGEAVRRRLRTLTVPSPGG
jgi:tetratricopeptide (TPR) repeat protein